MINYILDFEKAYFKLKMFSSWFEIQEILFQLVPDFCMLKNLVILIKTYDFCPNGYFLFVEEISNSEFEFTFANLDTF